MRPFYEELNEWLRVALTDSNAFPEHLHPQVEMLYVFEGEAVVLIDGAVYRLHPGDIAVCFPGVVHGYQSGLGAQALMMIFSPEISPDYSKVLTGSCPKNAILRRAQIPGDVAMCAEQMLKECGAGRDERVLRGYLQVVLARVIPQLDLVNRTPEGSDIMYGILQYLSRHFAEPVTLGELARALGVSKSYLSHIFSQRIGTNFCTYVNTLRVDRACQLLRSTDHNITHIAYDCGFETQRTFNRVFSVRYGMTPSEYRRSHRGVEEISQEDVGQ